MRIGLGYDIHPLVEGRKFLLGGVVIPFKKGALGHSDADCLYHALTDAILGALGLGDIGRHFPDSDPIWKDADSSLFLMKMKQLLDKRGSRIENIDANLHLESPKLAPYIPQMVENLSALLDVSRERVNLKAKSGEGMGAVGRGEAVAAQVVVLLCP